MCEMAETPLLALTPEILQTTHQNESLIAYLNNQVADLQKSLTNMEHQYMQTKTRLNGALNEKQQLSKKIFDLEKELEVFQKENALLQKKDKLSDTW